MVECKICGREYVYVKRKGHSKTVCNSCTVNKRRHILKQKGINFLGGKCVVCGYSKCNRALSFHHKNSLEKSFTIASNYMKSWDKIKKELKKCVLVCSNCHMEIEAGIINLNHVPSLNGKAPS